MSVSGAESYSVPDTVVSHTVVPIQFIYYPIYIIITKTCMWQFIYSLQTTYKLLMEKVVGIW